MTDFTLGVEEEFHLVDAQTLRLRPDAGRLVERARDRIQDPPAAGPGADTGGDTGADGRGGDGEPHAGPGGDVEPELLRTQVETGTAVCSTLAQVRAELERLRDVVSAQAAELGCRLLASGTYPGTADQPPITENERYEQMARLFAVIAREQVSCGCHVHVSIGDRELAVAVLRRVRPWLPVLLALSANSPYWQGADTGYASYRSQVWGRWPTAGLPPPFRSRAEYDDVVEQLLATGVLRDRGMIYWLVRASERYDTLEFRGADVCRDVDTAVLVAGLVRALARTCADAERAGEPVDDVRPEVLEAMQWRASRFGMRGELVDPASGRPVPAAQVMRRLLEHVRPALEEFGDADEVDALATAVLVGGTGADRQRAAYARRGTLDDVLAVLTLQV